MLGIESVGDRILDALAILAGKIRETAIGGRNLCLEAGFEHSRQQWRCAATGDRDK